MTKGGSTVLANGDKYSGKFAHLHQLAGIDKCKWSVNFVNVIFAYMWTWLEPFTHALFSVCRQAVAACMSTHTECVHGACHAFTTSYYAWIYLPLILCMNTAVIGGCCIHSIRLHTVVGSWGQHMRSMTVQVGRCFDPIFISCNLVCTDKDLPGWSMQLALLSIVCHMLRNQLTMLMP